MENIAELKNSYMILRDKAELCRRNARKACSVWAYDYWNKVAEKLEIQAGNLPVVRCQAEQKINQIEMWR